MLEQFEEKFAKEEKDKKSIIKSIFNSSKIKSTNDNQSSPSTSDPDLNRARSISPKPSLEKDFKVILYVFTILQKIASR